MLSVLTNSLVLILSAYISVTNALSERIAVLLDYPLHAPPVVTIATEDVAEPIPHIASSYEYGGALPDILIKNASYQKAAVIESIGEKATTTPMEDAIVNIYCTYKTNEYVRTTTGTGFFVHHNGVILTNAHVAQFLLLRDIEGAGETECTVRTNDTTTAYEVDLLYISPAWIQKHAALISAAQPKGTGERDYALLYVTKGVDNAPVPAQLPYLASHTELLETTVRGTEVTIGGYPAEKLFTEGPSFVPTQKTATTTLVDLFTFGSNYADIFYLAGTPIGEHGISGGPVVNSDGKAIGLISTKGDQEEQGKGSLNAITLSYVHRTMLEETGFGFAESVSGDLPYRAKIFRETILPFLSNMLVQEL